MKRSKEQLEQFAKDWNDLKAFPSRQDLAKKYGVSVTQCNNIAKRCNANGFECKSRAGSNVAVKRLWAAAKGAK